MISPLSPTTAVAATHALVKTGGGEYTADSVAVHPELAAGLVKLKDGNYAQPIVSAADRAGGIEQSFPDLKLGGSQ